MKLTTKTFTRAAGGAAIAALLATAASAQSPSWPTPPAPAPQAESPAPEARPASHFSAGRLAQMLAPIALYPDDLLADVLMAATYPLDVVEAARWLQEPQSAALKGDRLFAALEQKPWDPSVKSLTPFPRVLSMLDANLEWTEQLGEAYLADPAAVMDAVQRLRRRAQLAGRLVTTPQEIVRPQQQPSGAEEPITIEPPGPEVVYVPVCDPSLAYGSWPYPAYPPFFPLFAGATINGCGWISGPIIAPLFGFAILDFHKRRIDIDHKRLAMLDRDRDERREHPPVEEWRHDPGHRGDVPYRDPAVSALFQGGRPPANFNPALRGRWTTPPPAGRSLAGPPQKQPRAGLESASPLANGGRSWPKGIRAPLEGSRWSTARVHPPFAAAPQALNGVDPTWDRAPVGEPLNAEARRRALIEQWSFGRVPSTGAAWPSAGLRPFPSFGARSASQLLGERRLYRPLVGVGAQPFGARGPAIGVQPFTGQAPPAPFGAAGAGAVGAGRFGH
jgi:hypothetical protein